MAKLTPEQSRIELKKWTDTGLTSAQAMAKISRGEYYSPLNIGSIFNNVAGGFGYKNIGNNDSIVKDVVKGSIDTPSTDIEGWNRLTGGPDATFAQQMFGYNQDGNQSSGWADSAYTMGKTAFDGYMAYQGLQETKKQNAINVEAKNIALARQQTDQNNKVAQMRRNNAMGLSGGGGNYATIAAVARNPYSVYAKQQLRY